MHGLDVERILEPRQFLFRVARAGKVTLDKISWNQPWFVYVLLDCPSGGYSAWEDWHKQDGTFRGVRTNTSASTLWSHILRRAIHVGEA